MGFESQADPRRMLSDLKERLAGFGLALHEDKTRLIEFGRLPALARQRRGERRPETFAFLGFTHYCGWTRDGRFIVKHKTAEQPSDAQADGGAPGSVAVDAHAAGRPAGIPACCAAITAISACRITGAFSTRSGRKSGASGSTALDGGASRTGAWAGIGSRL